MLYFFDNCISHRYVECLKALGVDAEALRDTFSPDVGDEELFRGLKGRDIVYVSCDRMQTSRQHEARELKRIGCSAIYFGRFWNKRTFWKQAAWIVSRWETIDGFVNGAERGTIAEIKENGRAVPLPF